MISTSAVVPSAPSTESITPGSSPARTTTAPAPSPNRMQTVRSVMSSIFEITSAPITSTVSAAPDSTNAVAVDIAYEKPAHAAFTSNAGQVIPILRCTQTAVDGIGVSPDRVAQTIRSTCSARMPAASSARLAASTARSDAATSSSAKFRDRMPVRSTIHSSLVSTSDSKYEFGIRLSGRNEPTPAMVACRVTRRG